MGVLTAALPIITPTGRYRSNVKGLPDARPRAGKGDPVMFVPAETDTQNVSWCQTSPALSTLEPPSRGAHWWTRFIRWVVDARSHRVLCLVFGIWLLNAFDLTFTILAHQHGVLEEQNPVARQVLQQGTPSVMLFKIGLVLIGSYPLLRFRMARIAELGAIVVLVAYAALAFRWSNCLEIYSMTMPDPVNLADIEPVIEQSPQ